jgi:4-hydroxy-2-oxoglutarate aldolase
MAGSGGFFLPALVMGAVRGIMALAAVAPDLLAEIVEGLEKGDLKRAREIQARLVPVNTAITAQYGIPGLKAALDLIGLYGGPVRPPLYPLDNDQKKEVESVLKRAGII